MRSRRPCKYGSSCRYGPDRCRFLHPQKPSHPEMEDIHLRYLKYKAVEDITSYYKESEFLGWEDIKCDVSRGRFQTSLPALTTEQMEFLVYKRFGFQLVPPYGIQYAHGGYKSTHIVPFRTTTYEGHFSGYDYKKPIPKHEYKKHLSTILRSHCCRFCGSFEHHTTKCDTKAAEICHACDTRGHSTESCTRMFTPMEVKKRLAEHVCRGYKSERFY